jgi:hypothetical protein
VVTPGSALRASQESSAYQPCQPNVLQAIFRRHYAAFAESYPSRYACHYGRFRLARITKVSEAFIRCGDYPLGGSRPRSGRREPRVPQRDLPPLRLLLRLPYRVLTFTVPKMLRPYFRYRPELLAEVSRLIYRLVRQLHPGAARRPIRSGGLIAYQSSGEFLRFHPHWHAIFLEGGFDLDGRFLHIPFGNLEKMAQACRQRVLALFLELGLIDHDRAEGLLCWRRSGFSIDGSVELQTSSPS